MPVYEITIKGKPVAQPRPQVRVMIGSVKQWQSLWKGSVAGLWKAVRSISRGQAYVADSHAVHAWRRKIAATVRSKVWEDQLAQPLRVTCVFLMPRPQNMVWKTKPMPRVRYAKKTLDCDNLAKAVLDAINDSGVWSDDGIVCELHVERWYAAGSEDPGLLLSIEPLAK